MSGSHHSPASTADVAESLMREYEMRLPLTTISAVVREAGADLSGQTSTASLPELLHRLAHERLEEQLAYA